MIRAHSYWRMKQLAVDLVIVNERSASYVQDLQSPLESVVRVNLSRSPSEKDAVPGAVFLLRADLLSVEVRNLLQTVARVVIVSRRGGLAEQVKRLLEITPTAVPPSLKPRSASRLSSSRRRGSNSSTASADSIGMDGSTSPSSTGTKRRLRLG